MKTFQQFNEARETYHVYIHKSYFPDVPNQKIGKEDFEQWKVVAGSRNEAAEIIWKNNGKRLLGLMKPRQTKLPRKVSLHVSSPKAGTGGNAGRLHPILVYTGD